MELNETGFSDDGSCDRDELVPLLLAGIQSLAGLASELGHVTKKFQQSSAEPIHL
jgi:hypothetical protein